MRISHVILSHVIAVAGLALLCALAPARAEKRVALVIGNSAYIAVSPLRNPASDARLIAETLAALGFTLTGGGAQIDLDKSALDRAVQRFGDDLQGADVGLFYYAGHGVALHGANYLVPVDANVTREADTDFRMLNVNLVLQQMDPADRPGGRLNVVILDACRNNPFGGRGLRSADRGLSVMQAPGGTLISFATQPGAAAQDGDADHSPFTKALADSVRKPGLGLFNTFNDIGLAVKQATGGAQQPWVSSSPINGEFYFAGLPAAGPAASAAATEAERMWPLVQHSTNLEAIDDYIRRFGAVPIYGPLARAHREEAAKVAKVVTPPPAPSLPPAPPPLRPGTPLLAEQERGLKPKETFRECADCPEMVVVPAGSFTMGSPAGEKDRSSDEGPQHDVRISRPFAVGKFHVTRDQFAAFVNETGRDMSKRACSWRSPGFEQEGSHPVVCVSWDDANAYADWVAKKTGKPYRLLSEAEWEHAARGRTSPGAYPRFWFGNDEKDLCRHGNGWDQAAGNGGAPCNDGYRYTSPAGHYEPNTFGLYDMSGNAWQRTADCYHDNYNNAPSDGSAWTTGNCGGRVVRGGSWGNNPGSLRAANRNRFTGEFNVVSFRLARTLSP